MCNIKPGALLSPKNHINFNLEASGLKKGRFNPIPGDMGHGVPFQQFSGTYQGNDVAAKTGIASAAPPAPGPYQYIPTGLSNAAQARLAGITPYSQGQAASTQPGKQDSLASIFGSSPNVAVQK